MNNNKIPEVASPARPTVDEVDIVRNSNEIPLLRNGAEPGEEHPSNVLMSHAGDDSIFNKTEVLAGERGVEYDEVIMKHQAGHVISQ